MAGWSLKGIAEMQKFTQFMHGSRTHSYPLYGDYFPTWMDENISLCAIVHFRHSQTRVFLSFTSTQVVLVT